MGKILNRNMRFGAAIIACIGAVTAKSLGSINVAVDGVDKQVWVVGSDWSATFTKVENNGFTLSGGGRIYFAEKESDEFSPDMYW